MYLEDARTQSGQRIIEEMQHRFCYMTSYFGVIAQRNPWDFWAYQDLIFKTRPTVLIEIGNNYGGTTLALAHLFDALGTGRIIGVDITHDRIAPIVSAHPRITLVTGPAVKVVNQVAALLTCDDRVMVIEDSAHTYNHTLAVMRAYGPLVTPGCYMIVEDGIIGRGVGVEGTQGPSEAIQEYLKSESSFTIDRSCEPVLTWNPKGFLLKGNHA